MPPFERRLIELSLLARLEVHGGDLAARIPLLDRVEIPRELVRVLRAVDLILDGEYVLIADNHHDVDVVELTLPEGAVTRAHVRQESRATSQSPDDTGE